MSLFPSTTSITDFAYPETHPLRRGHFAPPDDAADDTGEINRRATALFDFVPENDNEVRLAEGQEIWISYRHGQGWLVAEDLATGENGLVPEEYVEIDYDEDAEVPQPFMKQFFAADPYPEKPKPDGSDSEWIDTDDEHDVQGVAASMNSVSL